MSSKNISYFGMFTALAVVMGYLERFIPVPVPIPGIKLGLANVIVIIVLYYMGSKQAFYISVVRIFIAGVLFSGFAGFLYSFAGAFLSFFVMLFMKEKTGASIIGVSVLGGIFHNVGQIITAAIVVYNMNLFYYLPVLIFSGVLTGIIVGIIAKYTLTYLKKIKKFS